MKFTFVLTLVIVYLLRETTNAEDVKPDSNSPISAVDEYIRLLIRVWKWSPSKHAKTRTGRVMLREYVAKLRSAYLSALKSCNNDTALLRKTLNERWNLKMINIFRGRTSSEKTELERNKLIGMLPKPLKTRPSRYPNDPYVDDPEFLNRLFDLQVSRRTFGINGDLEQVYRRYMELWMRNYMVYSDPLLSEVILMWIEVFAERIVSLVTEWEMSDIVTDTDDHWDKEIPSDVVSPEVVAAFDNDELYQARMQRHDLTNGSLLFYGLPNGERLPSIVPPLEVNLTVASEELARARARLRDDYVSNERGMDYLARVANQFLRATAVANATGSCPQDVPSCSHWSDVVPIPRYVWSTELPHLRLNAEETDEDKEVFECVASEFPNIRTSQSSEQDSGLGSPGFLGHEHVDFPEVQDVHDTEQDQMLDDALHNLMVEEELRRLCADIKDSLKHSRRKRDVLFSRRYKKIQECQKRVKYCVNKIRPLVSDVGALIRQSSISVKDRSRVALRCNNNQVLHVVSSEIQFSDFLVSIIKAFVFGSSTERSLDEEATEEKTLSFMRKECDGKNECSVNVDTKQISGHNSEDKVELTIDYECASLGCNPDLYDEKTVTADKHEPLIWQCNNDNEGILVNSAEWKGKDGFTVNADMNLEFFEHLKKYCNGKNKCNRTADLNDIAIHNNDDKDYVEVKYKCLPCKEFLRKDRGNKKNHT